MSVSYNEALTNWGLCVDALNRHAEEQIQLETAFEIARFTLEQAEADQESAVDPSETL